jgi:putative peptide zinc metalloprotease protein
MALQYPKIRKDLVVSRQEASGRTTFVIKDPVTGRFFRFKEEEQFIVQQLDGATPHEVIRKRAEERFGVSCDTEVLLRFVEHLNQLGLLEGEGPPVNRSSDSHKRVRGTLLYLRFAAFDPDRLFDRLIKKVGFFFTPHFVIFSAGIVLFALGITILNWGEIWRDFSGLFRFQVLLLCWLTMLFIVAAHEFAHGLACKHFGGQVHEIGFLLLFFQPAFYCNVSDAWLFPEKSKRLWVSFAGAHFELFLWALATLIWRLTDPGSLVHFQALVVTAASGIATLFNLNPLIKLDGYYMLSDYLEIPNLRQRAFTYLADRIKNLVGREGGEDPQEATPRERRIYIVYGLLAGAYSYFVLGLIALKFGGFLTYRYQGLGFILFTAVLLVTLQNQIRKAVFGFGPAMIALIKKRPRVFLLLTAVLAVLFLERMELKVAGECTIFPVHNADIRAEVEGIIQEVNVEQGDEVHKGDLLVALCDRDYLAELQKTVAQLHEKEANLDKLKAGPRREEIALARMDVEKARERIKYARHNLDRFKVLMKRDLTSGKELDEAEEQAAVRQKELEEAEGKFKVLSAGSRREEIDAARAEIVRLEVQQHYLKEQFTLVRVLSPVSGIITTHNLKGKIGQHVKIGDLITEVHEMKTVKAEITIPEKEIADVKVGQRVLLKVRAYPNLSFEGKVTSIAPIVTKGGEKWEERTILVTTDLDNPSLLLKPEMTGNAKIFCGHRRIFDLITRRLAHYIRVEFWSWW